MRHVIYFLRCVAMEMDTVISARQHLDRLRTELEQRGWKAVHHGTDGRPLLHVLNPLDLNLNETVTVVAGRFSWNWGPDLGHVDDVRAITDRIVHVLRLVGT